MNIQIFGFRKNRDSQKAERFFKEHGISFQFIDMHQKGMSPRELESVLRFLEEDDLIDRESDHYRKRGLDWMDFSVSEELLEDPRLFVLPIVRNGKEGASSGYAPDLWKTWIEAARS